MRSSRAANRGISLLILVFAITILSVFGIGLAVIMSAKFRTFPYIVQAHQAQALADAGIEFGIRYAKDNPDFIVNPTTYIPDASYKSFTFGNGTFELKYVPGCPDTLYSRGRSGSVTREVRVRNVGLMLGPAGNTVYISSAIWKRTYISAWIYSGYRVYFTFCDPTWDANPGGWMWVRKDSVAFASTEAVPIRIMRFGMNMSGGGAEWLYDGACGGMVIGGCSQHAFSVPQWDGTSDPPNASVTPAWNVPLGAVDEVYDDWCRPRFCAPDNNTCPLYGGGVTKRMAWCEMGMVRDRFVGAEQGYINFETSGAHLPPGTKFHISFDWGEPGYTSPPGTWANPTPWHRNKFIFTIPGP